MAQPRGSHLIQQRLEEMVIYAVQEDDANGGLLERPCRRQAAESSPR